jgi:acetyl esterase/lipase
VENQILHLTMFLASGNRNVKITKQAIPTRDGHILKAWVFTPKNHPEKLPCLVYFAGGGFMMGPNFGHKRNCAKIANEVVCKIILIPYRLAPRFAFPTALYDAFDGLNFVLDHAAEIGVDASRIALGGDSAGGTLTAGVTLMQRDASRPMPVLSMMLYPALDKGSADFESRHKYTDTPMFNTKVFAFIEKHYYKNGYLELERYAFPLLNTNFENLPNAYIETAEFDCLHDDGIIAAKRLRQVGKKVTLIETLGTFHAYDAIELSPVTKDCMNHRIRALKDAFKIQ